MTARDEAERRWPSPNSGLYEGLVSGFVLGAEWAGTQTPEITDEMVDRAARAYANDELSDEEWAFLSERPDVFQPYLDGMCAALEAALGVTS